MHPFSQSTAAAALERLERACEALEHALRARTVSGATNLTLEAQAEVMRARSMLRSVLVLEEMAVTTGEQEAVQ